MNMKNMQNINIKQINKFNKYYKLYNCENTNSDATISWMIVIERNKFFIIYIYIMNKNDISMNISINIIYNELLKMYNNKFNNLKTIETFSLPSIDNNMKTAFIDIAITAKNYGYEINFTIDELHNVLSYLELRAKLLTLEQQEKRKKVFINIKDILVKLKESGHLDTLINDLLKPGIGSLFDPNFNKALDPSFNALTSIKPNVFALHTLLLNIVDLFIEDIEDISNNIILLTTIENLKKENLKIENNIIRNKYIIIVLVILLIILFGILFYYINKKN